jgi:hypothetical protein
MRPARVRKPIRSRADFERRVDDILNSITQVHVMGKHLMANMNRLAGAIDAAAAVMTEAVEDIKWLRNHEDPTVSAKADELAAKLEAATDALKVETEATPPAPAPEPVVEEPVVEGTLGVEAPVEPVTE